ncbi:MAG: PP2C family serine/threonine-protein phosphatase [Bacteroidaceae bacterium]
MKQKTTGRHNMPLKVLEQFAKAKAADTTMEDSIVVTTDFCAVFDGSTTKTSQHTASGNTTGREAVKILSKAITQLSAQANVTTCADILTSSIAAYYKQNHLVEIIRREPEQRLTATAAIYSVSRNEVWLFGDCQCRIQGRTIKNNKKIDTTLAIIRGDILKYLLNNGYQIETLRREDLGRKFIFNALRDQCAFQNQSTENPFAYPVIDGTPISYGQIRIIHIPPHSDVILASDGYPELGNTLTETEQMLQENNLKDPLCIFQNPQTKGISYGANSFDDRSFLRFST